MFCVWFTVDEVDGLYRLANDDNSQDKSIVVSKESDTVEGEGKKLNKLGKCRSRISKIECSLDYGGDAELDQHGQGTPSSREEKISSLKTVSYFFLLSPLIQFPSFSLQLISALVEMWEEKLGKSIAKPYSNF